MTICASIQCNIFNRCFRAVKFRVLQRVQNFLTNWAAISFTIRAGLHGGSCLNKVDQSYLKSAYRLSYSCRFGRYNSFTCLLCWSGDTVFSHCVCSTTYRLRSLHFTRHRRQIEFLLLRTYILQVNLLLLVMYAVHISQSAFQEQGYTNYTE
jgi:hypothetical protein